MEGVDGEFVEFATARYRLLLRFALAVSGDTARAEDLVQTALLRTALRWQGVVRRDDPEGYVRRAIVREQINGWRRLLRRETPMASVPEIAESDQLFAAVEDRDQLWLALRALPPRQRAIIALRYLYDLSEQQTAQEMGCSVGTVKSQCSRGLLRLRVALSEDPDAAGQGVEHVD